MDQLWPTRRSGVDPDEFHGSAPRPAPPGRPWVMAVMVQSADGAATLDGLSGALGGDPDRRSFAALRRLPDAVLVAAGTVRAEDYGPPAPGAASRAAREARGLAPAPTLVVVTASLSLDPDSRLFADGHRPLIVTTADAPADRRATLAEVAEVVTVGEGRVDLTAVLGLLGDRGMDLVSLEGGPGLNAQMLAADLVDEWCLTIDPVVVGGDATRIVRGSEATPQDFRLDRLAVDDGVLFVRLVRSGRD